MSILRQVIERVPLYMSPLSALMDCSGVNFTFIFTVRLFNDVIERLCRPVFVKTLRYFDDM
jgi:hypothetical protein